MRVQTTFFTLALLVCLVGSASAQFKDATEKGDAKLGDSKTQRWQVGATISAMGGPCRGIVIWLPVPIEWPEQEVKVVEENIPSTARVKEKMVEGAAKMLVISVPQLAAGHTLTVTRTYEVKRYEQIPPDDTEQFVLPDTKKAGIKVRKYLTSSPYIESRHPKIKALAKEMGVEEENSWEHVQVIFDWVRDNIKRKKGPMKGALAALNDKTGDCEELTSLFIAICRAQGIPARTVWVPGHCYPEFYLADAEGKGHWFPCEVSATRSFGGIPDLRPILQKGDNLRPPYNRRIHQRYMSEHVIASGGEPRVRFIRKAVGG